jgi:SAM-dependent methyltransferase
VPLENLLPGPLRRALKRIIGPGDGGTAPQKPLDDIHAYWRSPDDGANRPEGYVGEKESQRLRSRFLVNLVKERVYPGDKILEIGCNVGRNLNYLFTAGYRQLEAIEISEPAVKLLRERFPEMAKNTTIYNMPVEEAIPKMPDGAYDAVYTMAVLEHIHTDSEWIFPEIVRITKKNLIVIEDEKQVSSRHFPRDYGAIFGGLGLQQIKEIACSPAEHGLPRGFMARVFRAP